MLRQIAPAHILHLADVGLQDKILGIGGELPELLQGSQAIKRLLNSGQEVTVFRGKSGKRLGRCRTTSPVRAPAPPPALFRRTCSYSPHRPDGRYSPHRPGISRRRCKPRAFPPSVHLPAAPSGRLHPHGSRSERRLVLVRFPNKQPFCGIQFSLPQRPMGLLAGTPTSKKRSQWTRF